MIDKIPQHSGARPLTLSTRPVRVPAASVPPGNHALAAPGMLVVYGDRHVGRVLGRIEAPIENRGWLAVLQLGSTADFAYVRQVDPEEIRECRPNPARFARWFFQERLPEPDVVARLAAQGRLNERSIASSASGPGVTAEMDPPVE